MRDDHRRNECGEWHAPELWLCRRQGIGIWGSRSVYIALEGPRDVDGRFKDAAGDRAGRVVLERGDVVFDQHV